MKRLFIFLLALLPAQAFAVNVWGTFLADGNSNSITCTTGIVGVKLDDDGGTWGTGTVTIYMRMPDGDYVELYDEGVIISWTANFDENIDKSGPTTFRLTMSGATSPTVDYYLNCANPR